MHWFLLETHEPAARCSWWRRLLQQLIIDGEKLVGQLSPYRRIKAIDPLGGFRSEQQGTVPEA